MASVLEIPQVKYQGLTRELSNGQATTTVIYQGSKENLERAQREEFAIGTVNPEYGSITKTSLTCAEGPFWNLQIQYSITTSDADFSSSGSSASGSSNGPTHSSLSVAMLSMPIEANPNYKCRWSRNLFICCTNPANLDTAKARGAEVWAGAGITPSRTINDMIANTAYEWNGVESRLWTGVLFWASSVSELPVLPQTITNYDGNQVTPYWFQYGSMTKPGVSTYDCPSYELTQYSRVKDKSAGGWVVGKRAGKIADPQKGDFGIVKKFGGNWLCEGGSVQHDGRSWLAELHYVWSGDSFGWDADIYDEG